jgi:recombinational DNA repair protein (RecF pathway)
MVNVGVIKVSCDACKEVIRGKYVHFSDGSIFCNECFNHLPKCSSCKKPVIDQDSTIDGLCLICYQRAPKCDICSKAITSSYTRFSDRTVACDACIKKYIKCARCGKPVVRYATKVRGKVLCRGCLTNAPRCTVCSNPIVQTHWVFDNELVCNYCYTNYERCDLCGIPNQFLFTVYKRKICYSCQENAKRCSACGLPIVGRYFSYKNKEGIFCEQCEHLAPHCDSCGRPVGLQYVEISDGRKICFECKRSAIITEKQFRDLINTAFKGIAELKLEIENSINFRLISKKLLDSRIKELGANVTAGRNLGLFHRTSNNMNIYLQTHLPVQLALGTLSHELAHVWLSENVKIKNQPIYIREGFCEWVAYKVLLKCGYEGQADLISSRDDLYGLGFKKVLQYEEKHGIERLIEWITRAIH